MTDDRSSADIVERLRRTYSASGDIDALHAMEEIERLRDATQQPRKRTSGILTLDVEGWTLSVRVLDGGYEVSLTEDGKCPATHYVRLDHEQSDTLHDFVVETSAAQPPAAPVESVAEGVTKRWLAEPLVKEALHRRPVECSSAEREDTTCYVERSAVREILLEQDDDDLQVTEEILRNVDALPIFVAADFRAVPQTLSTPEGGK